MTQYILADGRWSGPHGIGRFSTEVLGRLQQAEIFTHGPKPLAQKNLFWLPYQLQKRRHRQQVFFTPGFNPVLYSPIPFVFTIHDLIHLYAPGTAKLAKKLYYNTIMKWTAHHAEKILTVSEFSKKNIIEWANISAEKVIVVSSGVSTHLSPEGARHQPGYPYLLHVGNTKAHKNVARLVQAFALAKIDSGICLILTGELTREIADIIKKYQLEKRVIFSGTVTDAQLTEYYRGALGITFPSLYEGFGLPVLEGMACGTPVLTSNVTSMPEVAGDAAILIDPYALDSIAQGIEQLVNDGTLRQELIAKGLQRVKLFSWDETAARVQKTLMQIKDC